MQAPNSRVGPPSPQAGALPELPERLHGWGGPGGRMGWRAWILWVAQGLVLRWRRLWGACPGESEGGAGSEVGRA